MAKINPVHPGEILKTEFMEPLGISAYRLAKEIGVPQITISRIIRGQGGISTEMALRFSLYFGVSAESWLILQSHYELEKLKDKQIAKRMHITPYRAAA